MSERVLIVDDHPLTQEALASLLTQHGFEIVAQDSSGDEEGSLSLDKASEPAQPALADKHS